MCIKRILRYWVINSIKVSMVKKGIKKILSMLVKESLDDIYFLNGLDDYKNVFFGYYDISPFNPENNDLLCVHGQKDDGKVDIILYDLSNDSHRVVGNTTTWNFQQGSRLTWITDQEIIYNKFDVENSKYISLIQNVFSGKRELLPIPNEAFCKEFLISIDFDRLKEQDTEYGYSEKDIYYQKGSVQMYRFKSKNTELLFTEQDCISILELSEKKIEKQHINHVLISPSQDYFIFIFRYYHNSNRIDHLMGYNLITNEIELLVRDQIISHCTWKDSDEIFAWAKINGVGGYYCFNRNQPESIKLIYESPQDGHPSFINNRSFISDTYPNKFLLQELFIFDQETYSKKSILKKRHPVNFTSHNRCDLHPSLSMDKRFFQIDVIKNQRREVCIGRI